MNKITPSHRLQAFQPHFFATLGSKIASMQAAGSDVVRLDEGSPDLPPAPHIIQALARSAASPGNHSYQPHRGPQALRAAWTKLYERDFAVELDPETEILPLMGSKEGIFHMAMALVNPGDVVLVPDPGYITYTRGALFAGGEPVYLPLLPERGYWPDLQSIPEAVARRARLLWLNYPNNPTGATATLEFFQEALDFARKWGLLVCHDAAYTHVTFDDYRAPSILQVPGAKDAAVEFNTLSKTYNMAGWRVAAAAGNTQALRILFTLKSNQDSGQFLPVLEAAAAALAGDQAWIQARNRVYQERRDIAVRSLREMGLAVQSPRASLYLWCSVPAVAVGRNSRPSSRPWTSEGFCQALLEEACVSLTPGTVFGARGEGHVRISITTPAERLAIAMQRMKAWMADHT